MCTNCATPARRAASATRRVPSTLTRCSSSGSRPGCSAQARCTTASAPSRNRSSSAALSCSPRSARCQRTPAHGSTSGGRRRASPRTPATPVPGAARRRSSAVPTLPLAPVTATVRPGRWSRERSSRGEGGMGSGYPPAAAATCPREPPRLAGVITGAHVIVYSSDADADRAFLAGLLRRPSVDAGGGWMVTQLPPGEVAVHPAGTSGAIELYLVCDDVEATVAELAGRGIAVEGGIRDERWGRVTSVPLPGGGRVGLYEARHPTAFDR